VSVIPGRDSKPGTRWILFHYFVLATVLATSVYAGEPGTSLSAGGQSSSSITNEPVASASAKALESRTVHSERKFQDGTVCQITLEGVSNATNLLNEVTRMDVSIGGKPILMSPEVSAGLKDVDTVHGIQVAERGPRKYLLLAGGKKNLSWQAKLEIRGRAVFSREYTEAGGQPVIEKYLISIPVEPRSSGQTNGEVQGSNPSNDLPTNSQNQ
jgi:hypothetical protein